MELNKTDKVFLGSLLTAYVLVMSFVAIFAPQGFLPLLGKSALMLAIGFIVGWIVA